MPLKHHTETMMVFFLGLMIVLAGATAAFLPPVSVTIIPWAIAFTVSLAYPLFVYPVLKESRADYEFRLLHFVPALILLVWLAFDLLAVARPQWQSAQSWFTWGWSSILVIIALVLLALFCVRVLRQRSTRLGVLLAILLLFIGLSQLSDYLSWDRKLAVSLWNMPATGTGFIADNGQNSSNLTPSSNGAEEQWRAELRRMERRRRNLEDQIASAPTSSAPLIGATSSVMISSAHSTQSTPSSGSNSSTPPRLPSSGFGMESIGLLFAAAYCTTLHKKVIQRKLKMRRASGY